MTLHTAYIDFEYSGWNRVIVEGRSEGRSEGCNFESIIPPNKKNSYLNKSAKQSIIYHANLIGDPSVSIKYDIKHYDIESIISRLNDISNRNYNWNNNNSPKPNLGAVNLCKNVLIEILKIAYDYYTQ